MEWICIHRERHARGVRRLAVGELVLIRKCVEVFYHVKLLMILVSKMELAGGPVSQFLLIYVAGHNYS